MTSPHDDYAELVKSVKQHLVEEYNSSDRIFSDKETYEFFREYARLQKIAAAPLTPAQPQLPPNRPITPARPVHVQPAHTTYIQPSPPVASLAPKQESLVKEQPGKAESSDREPVDEKRPTKELKPLILDPLPPPKPDDLSDLHQLIQEKFPAVRILKNIPSDERAQQLGRESILNVQSSQVLFLTFQENESTRTFLENIAQAIRGLGVSAELVAAAAIEQAQGWDEFFKRDGLRLVISNHHGLHSLPVLAKHVKETDRQGRQYLGKIPLCLLSDVSVYQKEPKLKIPLWQTIKNLLGK